MDGLATRERDFRRCLALMVLLQYVLTITPPADAQVTRTVTATPASPGNFTASSALPGNVTASSTLPGNGNATSNRPDNINATQSQRLGNFTTTNLRSISLPSNVTNSTTMNPGNNTDIATTSSLPSNDTNATTVNPTMFSNNTNLTTVQSALPGNNTNLTTVTPLLGNGTSMTSLFPHVNATNGTAGSDALPPLQWDWSVIGVIVACSVLGFLQLLLLGLCCFLWVRKRKSSALKIGSKESLRPRDESDKDARRKSIMKSTKDGSRDKRTKSPHRVTIVENKEELMARTVPTPASQRRVLKSDNSGIGGLYFPPRYKMPENKRPPATNMYSVQAHINGKPVTFVRPLDTPEPTPPAGWLERFSRYLKEVGAETSSGSN
ncbi:PREDICTED: uncharacterized protein LOC109464874 [Branchiostoma belcheri]|uniref:Uncharacterized protein LOC109464874 n=1 Tax=Branchiostoma belcheri TaxID=7741 RepID=A0A6P4XZG1_BRABE|nr:PREDICTED: uncharacterized protein LOC109464874 [Branchiostoma belcheri]